MKEIKIVAIAVIVTIAMMIATACAMPACAEAANPDYGEFYPRLSVVVDAHGDTVICQDKEGNLWAFFCEDSEWEVGDICNLLMWNNSENVTDHEIVEVYWEGYTEYVDLFFRFCEWAC